MRTGSKIRLGGVGVRWRSPVGPVRVDFARGLTGPEAGYTVHFNLGADL